MTVDAPLLLALIWRPFFPPALTFAVGAVVAAAAVFACVRAFGLRPVTSVTGCAMRLTLIAAVVTLLLGPSTMPPQTQRPDRPCLTVMLDTSASMQTRDVDGQSRIGFAVDRWLSDSLLEELGTAYDVSLVAFDASARPMAPANLSGDDEERADGQASHIARSLTDTVNGLREGADGSAVLLISDGRDTQSEPFHAAARVARDRDVAVHTVALGTTSGQRDTAVIALPSQPYLLAGEEAVLNVRLLQSNALGSTTRLTVTCGDDVQHHDVTFANDDTVSLALPILHDEPGTYEYQVALDPLDGEAETSNNQQSVFVDVTGERMAVLILDGQPFWDTKFLAQSLRKDDRIGVTQIAQIAPQRRETILTRADDDQPRNPETLEDLAAYDVIILGKGVENVLSRETLALLPQYVSEQGGCLVFARGRAYDPQTAAGRLASQTLGVLEPVVWGGDRQYDLVMNIEPAGRQHPSLSGAPGEPGVDDLTHALPWLTSVPVVTAEKPSARVLARARPPGAAGAEGLPVLTTMPYHRGMVVSVLGEGLWRWRLGGRDHQDLAGVFDRFWSNMVRWMVMGSDFQPGQPVALRLAQRTVETGQPMSFDVVGRVAFDPEQLEVSVVGPDGQPRGVALRSVAGSDFGYRGEADTPEPGAYEVVVAGDVVGDEPLRAKFTSYRIDPERFYAAANPGALANLAEQTGGAVLDPFDPKVLVDTLERQRTASIVPARPAYVWDQAWLMVALLVWAGAEWLIRKQGGLL